jgi:hypothetical protein
MALFDSGGNVKENFSYDACLPSEALLDSEALAKESAKEGGRRRNPSDWTYVNVPNPIRLEKGFTGHACPPKLSRRREHYEKFKLIDMLSDAGQYSAGAKSRDPGLPGEAGNGRVGVYPASGGNPVIGRFLSPDPFIQSPDFTQSYNDYSYCINNPLKYFDPSGFAYNDPENDPENPPDPLSSYFLAKYQQGYPGSYNEWCVLFWDSYYKYLFNGGGGGLTGSGGKGTFAINWEIKFYYKIADGYDIRDKDGFIILRVLPEYVTGLYIGSIDVNLRQQYKAWSGLDGGDGPLIDKVIPYTSWCNILGDIAEKSADIPRKLAVRDPGKTARIDAGGSRIIRKAGTALPFIGIMGDAISIITDISILRTNPTPGNWGRLGVDIIIGGTVFIPYVGPYLAFGLVAVDVTGGFDGFYKWLDNQ